MACAESRSAVRPAATETAVATETPEPPPADAPLLLLEDLRGDDPSEGTARTDVVRRGLLASRRVNVMVRSEIGPQLAACTDAACQERVSSQLAEARYLVTGSVGELDQVFFVRLTLLHPSTGEVLSRVARQGRGDVVVMLDAAARELGESVPSTHQ